MMVRSDRVMEYGSFYIMTSSSSFFLLIIFCSYNFSFIFFILTPVFGINDFALDNCMLLYCEHLSDELRFLTIVQCHEGSINQLNLSFNDWKRKSASSLIGCLEILCHFLIGDKVGKGLRI